MAMTVIVHRGNSGRIAVQDDYAEGHKFTVDSGHLWIYNRASQPLGAYTPGTWVQVYRDKSVVLNEGTD